MPRTFRILLAAILLLAALPVSVQAALTTCNPINIIATWNNTNNDRTLILVATESACYKLFMLDAGQMQIVRWDNSSFALRDMWNLVTGTSNQYRWEQYIPSDIQAIWINSDTPMTWSGDGQWLPSFGSKGLQFMPILVSISTPKTTTIHTPFTVTTVLTNTAATTFRPALAITGLPSTGLSLNSFGSFSKTGACNQSVRRSFDGLATIYTFIDEFCWGDTVTSTIQLTPIATGAFSVTTCASGTCKSANIKVEPHKMFLPMIGTK